MIQPSVTAASQLMIIVSHPEKAGDGDRHLLSYQDTPLFCVHTSKPETEMGNK